VVALIEFLLRNQQATEAASWLDKLESLIESQTRSDPATIAQLIELRIRHGSNDRIEKLLENLSATDSDPLRPIALQAAWLASQGRTSEIDGIVEPVGKRIVAAASDELERGRRARLMGDLYWTSKLPAQAERPDRKRR
jgi:hypothetical protein